MTRVPLISISSPMVPDPLVMRLAHLQGMLKIMFVQNAKLIVKSVTRLREL